jgi:hypothetical protein
MGYLISAAGASYQLYEETFKSSDLQTNLIPLNINPCKALFLAGYAIFSGGTVAYSLGSLGIVGNTSGVVFFRSNPVGGLLGLNALVKFRIGGVNDQSYTPQAAETYNFTCFYVAGDGDCKIVIAYTTYS